VLVLGAGVAGIEAARVLAARGHEVEVWEKRDEPGGQMKLAMAAPDKREVEPVWSYRWQQVQALGVPVRTGMVATVASVREFDPDFAIVATGAVPRPAPFDLAGIGSGVRVMHAWDYLAQPAAIAEGVRVTIVGGGMVGMEAADLLLARKARVRVVEALAGVAQGMARNNRFELIERVRAQGGEVIVEARIERFDIDGMHLRIGKSADARTFEIGEVLLVAIGPRPVRDAIDILEAVGVPYELAGDCHRPGDFLTAIRDGAMVAMSVDTREPRSRTRS
jgi:NADPH-dependent 2,4-dienoyl-CoA reductase/sulfur reductase-like enzyme